MVNAHPLLNESTFKLMVENIKDYAIFLVDTDGTILSWNKGAELIKGYKPEEIIGKNIEIFYTAEDNQNNIPRRNLQKAKRLGQFEEEAWRVRKDGTFFWANITLTVLRDEKGNVFGFSKVTRDLTTKKQAEEQIRDLNVELGRLNMKLTSEISDYKHALDEAAIIAVTNQHGIITYVNDNFCKTSKYSREELIGRNHRIVNSGYHSKEFFRNLWDTISSGNVWRGEIKNKAKDGSLYWVDTTIVPFLNDSGEPYQYVAIRNNITQRKFAEEEVLKLNKNLEKKIKERTFQLTEALEREKELNEMKSRFVSTASHEFRTPLTSILSSVALVEHYTSSNQEEKRKKHIDRIKSSVKNLTDILNGFLSLDKLEQGEIPITISEFDLYELIKDVAEEMEDLLKKKSQKINFAFKGPKSVVQQDKKILTNVLLNLLSNAIKYSPEEKTIFIDADVTCEEALISIRDEGIGIPQAAQPYLFSKFFRANNATTIPGTGLGLNIVKKYLELLNGNISFKSEEQTGSVFTIKFPRVNKMEYQIQKDKY